MTYSVTGYCPESPEGCALEQEDGGAAIIFHVDTYSSDDDAVAQKSNDAASGMFVRIQSYDERAWSEDASEKALAHQEIRQIFGKRVRVTIEVLDD
jgi:hypothetical protein